MPENRPVKLSEAAWHKLWEIGSFSQCERCSLIVIQPEIGRVEYSDPVVTRVEYCCSTCAEKANKAAK